MSFETERIPEPPEADPPGRTPWGTILLITCLEVVCFVALYRPVFVPIFNTAKQMYYHSIEEQHRFEPSEESPVVVEAEKEPDPPEVKPLYDWERQRLKDLEKRENERIDKMIEDLKKTNAELDKQLADLNQQADEALGKPQDSSPPIPPAPTRRRSAIGVDAREHDVGITVVSNAYALDMKALKAGLEPVMAEISLCNWDDIRRSRAAGIPMKSGVIEFEYTILSMDGHVDTAIIVKDTMNHPQLAMCAAKALSGLVITEPTANVKVRHPIEFQQF